MITEASTLRSLWKLAAVNSGVWAISLIALIFLIQEYPGVRDLFPVLAGGSAVATILLSVLYRYR